MYKFDIRLDPSTGLQTVYMLPQDVIDNTRRAFSTSTTSSDGVFGEPRRAGRAATSHRRTARPASRSRRATARRAS